MKRALSILATLAILGGGAALVWWLLGSGPRQQKTQAEPAAPVVSVVPLRAETRAVAIQGFGTVTPAREVALAPEVEGRVVEIHADMEPGAVIRSGELLARIDPADYRLAVRRAEAELAQARADLEVERGRGRVAEREWSRYGGTLETVPEQDRAPALALREPQRKQAEARVAVAENAVEEARLRLRRTELRAPFDAFVVEESLEVGRQVTPGTPVVTLAGVDAFRIIVSVPLDRAGRLAEAEPGSPVEVLLDRGLGAGARRPGRFVRRLPDLTAEGRMARALVAIDDPLALDGGAAPIPAGSYVEVEIPAGVLREVYEVPRQALRENGRVWVRDAAGLLRFRDVQVVWRREESVLLRGDFEPGDELITSYLSDALPGTRLRRRAEEAAAPEALR